MIRCKTFVDEAFLCKCYIRVSLRRDLHSCRPLTSSSSIKVVDTALMPAKMYPTITRLSLRKPKAKAFEGS